MNKLTAIMVLLASSTAIWAQDEIIDSSGDGTHTLGSGAAIALDASENVYVAGSNSNNVFRVDASTTCATNGSACTITEVIDSAGDRAGNALDRAAAVAVDSLGNLYVVGQFSDNVFRISNPDTCGTDGPLCTIAEIIDDTGDGTGDINMGTGNWYENPTSIAIDSNDNVYVAGFSSNNVFRIAASTTCSTGGTACTITEIIDAGGDGSNPLTSPAGVATDSAGNVYMTTQNSNNVFRVAAPTTCSVDGTPCTITEILDDTGDGSTGFGFGRGIVTDSADNVYTTGIGFFDDPTLFRIDTPGSCSTAMANCTVTLVATRALPNQYTNIAMDPDDNLFIGGGNGEDGLKITNAAVCQDSGGTACMITTFIDSTGDGMGNILDGPGAVAASNQNVYIGGGGSDNVFRINGEATPVTLEHFSID